MILACVDKISWVISCSHRGQKEAGTGTPAELWQVLCGFKEKGKDGFLQVTFTLQHGV
jgi:hypothetical protein